MAVFTKRRDEAERFPQAAGKGPLLAVAPDVFCLQLSIVNVCLVGAVGAGDRGWVLVDAGLFGSAGAIRRAAQDLYGRDARPSAIVLTHGHFDHIGSARSLAELWDVPIYAHRLEMPYLTGHSAYPPTDPSVGGGLMARLSKLYPNHAVDLRPRLRVLLNDHSVPHLPDWRWIPTPGHSPGHVSLFRDDDRTLIAGDAFVTTKQESALAVMTQRPELHGPPAYFTCDWNAAERSVRELAALEPIFAVTGHGRPMSGEALQHGLDDLAANFERLAVPDHGRYVDHPAVTDEDGIVSIPPPVKSRVPLVLAGLGAAAVVGFLLRKRGPSDDGAGNDDGE